MVWHCSAQLAVRAKCHHFSWAPFCLPGGLTKFQAKLGRLLASTHYSSLQQKILILFMTELCCECQLWWVKCPLNDETRIRCDSDAYSTCQQDLVATPLGESLHPAAAKLSNCFGVLNMSSLRKTPADKYSFKQRRWGARQSSRAESPWQLDPIIFKEWLWALMAGFYVKWPKTVCVYVCCNAGVTWHNIYCTSPGCLPKSIYRVWCQ